MCIYKRKLLKGKSLLTVCHFTVYLGGFTSAYTSMCDFYGQAPIPEVYWVSVNLLMLDSTRRGFGDWSDAPLFLIPLLGIPS